MNEQEAREFYIRWNQPVREFVQAVISDPSTVDLIIAKIFRQAFRNLPRGTDAEVWAVLWKITITELDSHLRRRIDTLARAWREFNYGRIQDVAQETLILVWNKSELLRERNPRQFLAWVLGTAWRVLSGEWRRERRRSAPPEEFDDREFSDRDVGARRIVSSIDFDRLVAALKEIAATVDNGKRRVECFVRHYLLDEPRAPIASDLGIAEVTVTRDVDFVLGELHRRFGGSDDPEQG